MCVHSDPPWAIAGVPYTNMCVFDEKLAFLAFLDAMVTGLLKIAISDYIYNVHRSRGNK